jgi:hypothetical protein
MSLYKMMRPKHAGHLCMEAAAATAKQHPEPKKSADNICPPPGSTRNKEY